MNFELGIAMCRLTNVPLIHVMLRLPHDSVPEASSDLLPDVCRITSTVSPIKLSKIGQKNIHLILRPIECC